MLGAGNKVFVLSILRLTMSTRTALDTGMAWLYDLLTGDEDAPRL